VTQEPRGLGSSIGFTSRGLNRPRNRNGQAGLGTRGPTAAPRPAPRKEDAGLRCQLARFQ